MTLIKIKKKEYNIDCSTTERNAIKERIYMHDHNIMYWKEVPLMSEYQVDLFFEKMAELSSELSKFYLIIDLVEADPPNAKIRKQLSENFNNYAEKIQKVAVFTEKNFLLNIAAKFVLSRAFGQAKVTVDKTLLIALERLKENG